MFGMILVDDNGAEHPLWIIRHSVWNGFTMGD